MMAGAAVCVHQSNISGPEQGALNALVGALLFSADTVLFFSAAKPSFVIAAQLHVSCLCVGLG